MNERRIPCIVLVLACFCAFAFSSCRTVPDIDTSKTDVLFMDVIETQTEVITTGNDVANTIDDIKAITDDAKVTGEIPKEKVVTLIKYVDVLKQQDDAHNQAVTKQTGLLPDYERSRQNDNANHAVELVIKEGQYQSEKIKASIFFRWALIATVIALVLAGILWLPKLLKLIL